MVGAEVAESGCRQQLTEVVESQVVPLLQGGEWQ